MRIFPVQLSVIVSYAVNAFNWDSIRQTAALGDDGHQGNYKLVEIIFCRRFLSG